MNREVFLYWTGPKYSLIHILYDIIKVQATKQDFKATFLDDTNLHEYINIQELPQCFNKLKPAHKADVIRVFLLEKYGGIWVDSDTIVTPDFNKLFEEKGFFVLENNTVLWNGVFGTQAHSPLMVEWKRRIQNTLTRRREKIKWTQIGSGVLENIKANNNELFDDYTILNGLDTVYPVYWKNACQEFLHQDYTHYVNLTRNYQPFVVLVNSVYKELQDKSYQEILKLRVPLVYFLFNSL
jgi:hypothetical protein